METLDDERRQVMSDMRRKRSEARRLEAELGRATGDRGKVGLGANDAVEFVCGRAVVGLLEGSLLSAATYVDTGVAVLETAAVDEVEAHRVGDDLDVERAFVRERGLVGGLRMEVRRELRRANKSRNAR